MKYLLFLMFVWSECGPKFFHYYNWNILENNSNIKMFVPDSYLKSMNCKTTPNGYPTVIGWSEDRPLLRQVGKGKKRVRAVPCIFFHGRIRTAAATSAGRRAEHRGEGEKTSTACSRSEEGHQPLFFREGSATRGRPSLSHPPTVLLGRGGAAACFGVRWGGVVWKGVEGGSSSRRMTFSEFGAR